MRMSARGRMEEEREAGDDGVDQNRLKTAAEMRCSGEKFGQPGGARERGKLGEWKRRSGRFYRSY